MNLSLRRWLQVSLFNLCLIAALGVIMRYKIAFSLAFVDQKNLLHAHSHFAFAGWITQALMSLLVACLEDKGDEGAFKRYRKVLYANLITAYGMLVTFPFEGYGLFSIIFSTLSIFASYWFAIVYWRDLNRLKTKDTSHHWFKAAVLFNAVSSLGAFSLAFMLATKSILPERYLASIYFFLHFQYNGWFFFACMGLLAYQLYKRGVDNRQLKRVYLLFVTACVPAYFLSALWLPIPGIVYILVVLAVFLQLAGWGLLIALVRRSLSSLKKDIHIFPQRLLILCAVALTIKLCLQAGSVIPSLSKLAFGFRPIVIGYLHLVLLGVISLFIISYVLALKLIPVNKMTVVGVIVFTAGIIVNEVLLMSQGIADLNYQPVLWINPLLLDAAVVLFGGAVIINYGQRIGDPEMASHKSGFNR